MCPTGGSDALPSVRNLAVEYETIDLGAIFRVSDTTRLGVMFKNVVGFSYKDEYNGFTVPKYATLAMSHTIGPTTWFLRGGIEHRLTRHICLRAGLVYPVVAETSASGNLKEDIPWPGTGASLGLGLVLERFNIDLALYGDPGRSYVAQTLILGATGTLIYKF